AFSSILLCTRRPPPASPLFPYTTLFRSYAVSTFPEDGDTLIHTLIATGGHDVEWLTEEQLAAAPIRVPLDLYRTWFDALPASLRSEEHTSELQSLAYLVCRLLLEKKKTP